MFDVRCSVADQWVHTVILPDLVVVVSVVAFVHVSFRSLLRSLSAPPDLRSTATPTTMRTTRMTTRMMMMMIEVGLCLASVAVPVASN